MVAPWHRGEGLASVTIGPSVLIIKGHPGERDGVMQQVALANGQYLSEVRWRIRTRGTPGQRLRAGEVVSPGHAVCGMLWPSYRQRSPTDTGPRKSGCRFGCGADERRLGSSSAPKGKRSQFFGKSYSDRREEQQARPPHELKLTCSGTGRSAGWAARALQLSSFAFQEVSDRRGGRATPCRF